MGFIVRNRFRRSALCIIRSRSSKSPLSTIPTISNIEMPRPPTKPPPPKALENYLREQNINPRRVCQGKRRDFRRLISAVRANRFQLRPGILYPRIIVLPPSPPPLFLSSVHNPGSLPRPANSL